MEVVVYLRSWKAAAIGAAAIAIAIVPAALAFETDARRWNYFSAAVLLFASVFFSGLGLALLVRAISANPAIRTGREGIEFRSVPFMSGFVPYADVARITAIRYGAAQYVAVFLREDEGFLDSQPRLLRPVLRRLSKAGHPVCVILVGVGRGEEHRANSERIRLAMQSVLESGHAA
jgi:hypothetical protein